MADITEIQLPGVGIRHDFTTSEGERVSVLAHHGGRLEVLTYDRNDPDRCTTNIHLDDRDARTLAELLGASQVSATVQSVQQEVEGISIDWVTVHDDSPLLGVTLSDSDLRSRTGATVVAVVRDTDTLPAPGPDFALAAGDVAVAVGTADGLTQLRTLIRG